MDLSDKEYVERSRDGYPDDFQALVQRYQKPLFVYLAARLGDPLQAEEAARETFVRAFLGLQKLRKPESFFAWLIGIAGRVLKEQFRMQARRDRNLEAAEALSAEPALAEIDYPLEEAIAALPESYRRSRKVGSSGLPGNRLRTDARKPWLRSRPGPAFLTMIT
jgi:DNA-directed RNA polymerase specialized sigma24 family protein